MEWWQNIGDVTTGTAIGGIIMYFFNQFVSRVLDERNQWLQSVAADRKETSDKMERLLDRYDSRLVENVTALRDAAAQDHALRGKITEFMVSMDNLMRSIDNKLRGSSRRDAGDD